MQVLQRISAIMFAVAILNGCASLPKEIEHPTEPSVPALSSTLSDLVDTARPEQSKQGTSAVLLQDTGWDALAQRLALIESAEHSIDIQYYIWNSDNSGKYLAKRIIAAADRGVKVRIMLDDINLDEREDLLTALDSHPHIQIRIFNPIPTRRGVTKWLNFLGDFDRLNRRMHNKSFTVDGAMSIVGGRNIGDEYFDLSDEINFRDRDVLVIGSVVTDIQANFGEYWGSRWAYPVSLLGGEATTELPKLDNIVAPSSKSYPSLPEGSDVANTFLKDLMDEMTWVEARYISDQPIPVDVDNTNKPKETARFLAKLSHLSQQEIVVESAYLIFDDRQLGMLALLINDGIQVKALTNSMVSNDLVTNHSGYAGRRHDMLDHGIQLFELKPEAQLCVESTRDESKCAPTTAYGLHAKSVVFDRKVAVIGSFNFNLRSTYLNTESILVIEDERIAKGLADDIERAMSEDNSWRLNLDNGDIRWYSGMESWDSEPEAGRWERLQSRFLQFFPIEKYL
ncbi:phospholipase D family protein [Photobacterium lutimaris]|uniref:Phospholipase D family protein n=1 Tax=Photobacterium lutimaris TaxID=388278 RepID=A0A2T3J4P8_9GAMM|nr:phospholipase D family protein [Photobacterium lutimaris]PSU36270.1 phospholipase D family protein [Photobacterium lutimaris]TDR74849.1 putative cardiolipin synthase [Photobacterium lutimaris]